MVISLTVSINGRGGLVGGGDLSFPPQEHSCTVHCNQYHYGPVSGGGEAYWVTGGQALVETGWIGPGRNADSILGGVMGGGSRGY